MTSLRNWHSVAVIRSANVRSSPGDLLNSLIKTANVFRVHSQVNKTISIVGMPNQIEFQSDLSETMARFENMGRWCRQCDASSIFIFIKIFATELKPRKMIAIIKRALSGDCCVDIVDVRGESNRVTFLQMNQMQLSHICFSFVLSIVSVQLPGHKLSQSICYAPVLELSRSGTSCARLKSNESLITSKSFSSFPSGWHRIW